MAAVIEWILRRKHFRFDIRLWDNARSCRSDIFASLRQTQQFRGWHLEERERLTALRNQLVVLRSCDPKSAPEPDTFHLIEPALNYQPISEFRRAAIINLRAYHHGISLLFSHFCQTEAEFLGQMCARDLDEAQIRDVRNHASAVGIEKHHLHVRADSRGSHSTFLSYQI